MKITNQKTIEIIFKSFVNWNNLEDNIFQVDGRDIYGVAEGEKIHIIDKETEELIMTLSDLDETEIRENPEWLKKLNYSLDY